MTVLIRAGSPPIIRTGENTAEAGRQATRSEAAANEVTNLSDSFVREIGANIADPAGIIEGVYYCDRYVPFDLTLTDFACPIEGTGSCDVTLYQGDTLIDGPRTVEAGDAAITGLSLAVTEGDAFAVLVENVTGEVTLAQPVWWGKPDSSGAGGGGDMLSTNNLSDVADAATARTNLDVYSQGEVDTLLAGAGGGWTAIETINTTSGTNVVFDNIPDTYSELLLEWNGVSHDSGSSQNFTIEFSHNNGGAYTATATLLAVTVAASATLYGQILISNYAGPVALWWGYIVSLTADNAAGSAGALRTSAVRMSAGIDAIRIAAGGGNLDAGSIRLLGR